MKRSVALAVASALAVAGLGTAQWAGASSTTPGTSTPTAGVRDSGTIVLDWNRALLRLVRTPGAQVATFVLRQSLSRRFAPSSRG